MFDEDLNAFKFTNLDGWEHGKYRFYIDSESFKPLEATNVAGDHSRSVRVPTSGYLEFSIGMEIYDRIVRVTADNHDFRLPASHQFTFTVDDGALVGGVYQAPCAGRQIDFGIAAADPVAPRLLVRKQEVFAEDVDCTG